MGFSRYIAIEGPIGVGKTSLARLVADRFKARLELEEVDSNPFLRDFYRDRSRYAFQTQIFFLLTRYQRQQELLQPELFNRSLVSDYLFAKDRIFAYLNLDDQELKLYERFYSLLDHRQLKPDLVVYLRADPAVLIGRIEKRGHPYERDLSEEYLRQVCEAYGRFFAFYDEGPLLSVDTTEVDLLGSGDDFERLVKEIEGLDRGTHYFLPLGSKSLD